MLLPEIHQINFLVVTTEDFFIIIYLYSGHPIPQGMTYCHSRLLSSGIHC